MDSPDHPVDPRTQVTRPRGIRGPLTQRQLNRVCAIGAVVLTTGIAVSSAAGVPVWARAIGASLTFPGAGLLYTAPSPWHSWWMWIPHVLAFAEVVRRVPQAMRRMITRGDYVSAPALVLGAAVVSAVLGEVHASLHGHPQQGWVPPVCAAVTAGLVLARGVREHRLARQARQVGDERNAYLAKAACTAPPPPPSLLEATGEHTGFPGRHER